MLCVVSIGSDHRGGEVEGQTFREWWINEYMISNETLFHKNPHTGEPQMIGLGWLDDRMQLNGPTEEDGHVSVQLLAF